MHKILKWTIICAVSLISSNVFSQADDIPFWTEQSEAVLLKGAEPIQAEKFRTITVNLNQLKQELIGVKHRDNKSVGKQVFLNLPHPDGTSSQYEVFENNTMHSDLKTKFPEIRSYDAVAKNGDFAKIDVTPHGFHAMILSPSKGSMFIDPYSIGDTKNYKVYFKKDFVTDKRMNCTLLGDIMQGKKEFIPNQQKQFGTCELRTYRFAVSATGEYTTFHGGTVALAQAAQVTTMNRVNAIYERDMAITMTIIGNNNLIIFTNSGTDPFTNGTPGSMINENQTEIDNTIGSGNYDMGHVFGTNSGGLAGLGVVCSNGNKARGVTGSSAPVGDPFDIDYVAHETGHQFGANHTQNNDCNRNGGTAMEPGSASTIMGYAGICAPDVQSNSDDHFHGISLEEIHDEITSHGCPVITSLANAAPVISGTNGNITVPANTPFALTATATDADGDPLYYCWEQMDNTTATMPPVATSTAGPNFRSNSPINNDTRYFPNLADLAAGISPVWEVIPSVTRTMNFRVTVRDQSVGVIGCNDHADVTLTTDAGSGPFIVQVPNNTGIVWTGNGTETVTWDVANTDNAPVSCTAVDILLSTDGGLTYPTVVATGVANDGSEVINVPNISTTTARIMVICSNGTFFDISDNDFEITMLSSDYTLTVTNDNQSICAPTDAIFNIDVGSFGGYADPVNLSVSGVPAGGTATFGNTSVTPGNSTTLTISNTGAIAAGTYTINLEGNSTTGIKTVALTLSVSNGSPAVTILTSPIDGSVGVATPVNFSWSAGTIGNSYDIDIATDNGFTSIVDNAIGLTTNSYNSSALSSGTTYYWRVRVYNGCGIAGFSSTFSFETVNEIILPPTGTATTQTTCSGVLFDSGGSTGNYGDGEDAQITISPTGALSVDLTFTSFNIEAGSASNCDYDWLDVFDGPTTGSTLIGRYCNDNIPTSISSTGGSITLVFHSDNGVNEAGFEISWQCNLSSIPPVASFSSDVTTTCTGVINFSDESNNGPTSWTWDFGDATNSTSQNPTHTYTASGDYSVTLTSTNAFGSDAITITDYITVTLPVAPTTIGDQICESGTVNLSAYGGTQLDWYDALSGGTLVNSGVTFTTPTITTTTAYYVESVIENASQFGAKPDNTGGGGNFTGDQHLIFDAYTDFELVSVEVVANGPGDRTIEWRNSAGTVLDSRVVTVPDGTSRIALNFNIVAGTDYQLGIAGTPDLYRNNAGVSYPYDLAGLGAVTTSSPGLDYYYFFYDWEVKEPACISSRTEVTATVNPLPAVDAGIDQTVCNGDMVTLSAVGTGTITWDGSVNDGTPFTPTAGNNTYTATIVDANSCQNMDQVNVMVNALPTVDAGIDRTVCDGDMVTLSAVGTGTITWDGSVNDGTPFTPTAGNNTYTATIVDANSCQNLDQVNVTVNSLPDTNVTVGTPTLTAISGYSYQWYDCDNMMNVSGAIAQDFTPTSNGNYAVILDDAGCIDTSGCRRIIITDVSSSVAYDLSIYPNPTEGFFEVNMSAKNTINEIRITDITGRVIDRITVNGQVSIKVNLSGEAKGVYFLTAYSGKGSEAFRILKQ